MSFNELMMSLQLGLIYGIVAMGIYLTYRIIDFTDLTCDGSFVLGAAASAMLIKSGYSPWLALLIALMAGSLAGLLTGVLATRFKVTDLLAGILVSFMLYSINLRVMGGVANIALLSFYNPLSDNTTLIILLVIALISCTLCGYLLTTDFGLALRSIGQNKNFAQYNGVNVRKMTLIGLALSNSFIALGGALFSQQQGFADIGAGAGTVIIGLASIMIGEKILPYRSLALQLASCIVGSIIYRLLISIALHCDILGLQSQDLNLMTGLLVVTIMWLSRRRHC